MASFSVGLIGLGTIGMVLAEKISRDKSLELAFVFDLDKEKLAMFPENLVLKNFEDFQNKEVDLVVEAAGFEAVKSYAPLVLKKTNLLILSYGALADEKFGNELKKICTKHDTKLFIPSGSIAGLDGISAVKEQLEEVELVTRKNPKSFGRDDKEETVIFQGSAREACKLFPKNINVAAALSLNGLGFDRTKVKIISDPKAKANSHSITAKGSFGKFFFKVENVPSKNPKTSALAALSAFDFIKKVQSGLSVF